MGNGGVSTLQKYEDDVWLNKCVNDLRIQDNNKRVEKNKENY